MIDLIVAAALAQSQAPDPCNAAGQPVTPRPGCPAWRYVGQRSDGAHYIDPASLRRSGDRFEITGRIVLFQFTGDGPSSATTRARYDCTRRSVTALVSRIFDTHGVLTSEQVQSGDGDYVADESAPAYNFDAVMLREFCPH